LSIYMLKEHYHHHISLIIQINSTQSLTKDGSLIQPSLTS
jgi:hypothetical protein